MLMEMKKYSKSELIELIKISGYSIEDLKQEIDENEARKESARKFISKGAGRPTKFKNRIKRTACYLDPEEFKKLTEICKYEQVSPMSKMRDFMQKKVSKYEDLLDDIRYSKATFKAKKKELNNKWKVNEVHEDKLVRFPMYMEEDLYNDFVLLCNVHGSSLGVEMRKYVSKFVKAAADED